MKIHLVNYSTTVSLR